MRPRDWTWVWLGLALWVTISILSGCDLVVQARELLGLERRVY